MNYCILKDQTVEKDDDEVESPHRRQVVAEVTVFSVELATVLCPCIHDLGLDQTRRKAFDLDGQFRGLLEDSN